MGKGGNRAVWACGWGGLLALCLSVTAGGAFAEGTSLRPKPRPAVAAAETATPDTPGEADGGPTEDGVAAGQTAPAAEAEGGSDPAAGEAAAAGNDSPALAAPAATSTAAPAPKDAKPKPPPRDPNRGPITNLPMPRYVSLKGKEGNARRGPGLTHRIDWVFVRAGMPLRITGEYEHWRRIEDSEGAGGWVHYSLLSGVRSAQVVVDMAEFHDSPEDDAAVSFKAEKDVIGWIQECSPDWCRLSIEGEKGWVRKTALWGVDPGEIVE